MKAKNVIKSSKTRKRVQLGALPIVVGSIRAHGGEGLIGTFGVAESIALLSALIAVQVYLIAARVWFDFRGTS